MTDPLFTPLKSHPSTWQAEVAQLRDENTDLILQAMASNAQAAEAHEARLEAEAEAEALRARVAELKKALVKCVNRSDLPRDVERIAFAALQEGGAEESTTQPHSAIHSAKSVPPRG